MSRLLIPMLLLAVTLPLAAAAGEVATVDGVPHVRNAAEPRDGVRTLELEEVWRRGGEDDEEILFGVIFQVDADEDGNVYLLDTQLAHVEVFDPDGEHVTTLGREGDGPGEVRNPGDMYLTDDGRVGMGVAFPGRLVYVDRHGEPAGTVDITAGDPAQGGFTILRTCRGGGGHTVVGVTLAATDPEAGRQTRRPLVAELADDGTLGHVYVEDRYEIDFSELTFKESEQLDIALRRMTVGGDGRVYVAPDRESYRIDVFAPDGALDRVIERDYPVHQRTDAEIEEWRQLFLASMRGGPPGISVDICETAAPIDWVFGGMWVRDDGRLWVRTSRSAVDQPDGIMLTYDVFDPAGHFVEQVRVACPGDGHEDALFFAGADRMILITGFMDSVRAMFGGVETDAAKEPEPMQVVCYQVR
jgi:hypothetical protein